MVVDDDQIEVMLSAPWLENAGFEVLQAASCDEAADLLRTDIRVDFVLKNWIMPSKGSMNCRGRQPIAANRHQGGGR